MKTLYIARCGLPNTAPGIRVYNVAKVLELLGHEVDFLCRQENDLSTESVTKYENFTYYFSKHTTSKFFKRISLISDILFAKKTYNRILGEVDLTKYDSVILYNDTLVLTRKLLKIQKKHKFKIYGDVTEWYEVGNGRSVLGSLVAILTNIRIKNYDKKLNGVIAISNYLNEYYQANSVKSIFVPPIFFQDKKEPNFTKDNSKIIITYAGSPGAKDILRTVIDAIRSINEEEIKVVFNIIGIDANHLEKKYAHKSGDSGIYAHGRIEHESSKNIIGESDFTVLFRKPLRYAKAGYSTKFAESMMLGIPVICNEVGGADEHVDTEVNGIKIKNASKESISEALHRILKMSDGELIKMKKNAFSTGKELYSPEKYLIEIKEFFN